MATIKLTDEFSVPQPIDIPDTSVLGRSPESVIHFVKTDVLKVLDTPINKVDLGSAAVGLIFTPELPLSIRNASFHLGGGATGEFDIIKAPTNPKPGSSPSLFPDDELGDDPTSLDGCCYTKLAFTVVISAAGQEKVEALTLKQSSQGTGTAAIYLRFPPTAGNYPTLREALKESFAQFVLPSDEASVKRLPAGSVLLYEASGSVIVSGSVDLIAAVNPTATVGVKETFGKVIVEVGPSLKLGGSVTVTGDFQVRIRPTVGSVIRIGYYKQKGSTFAVTFDASASASVSVDGTDVVSAIFGILGPGSKVSDDWLKQNGATAVSAQIQEVVKQAVQTKLQFAFDMESDASVSNAVAFLYDFDFGKLDATGQTLLDKLLRGDISALNAGVLPNGITAKSNLIEKVRSGKHIFALHFLGLLNFASIEEFALKSTVKYTDGGDLCIADQATGSRLGATTQILGARLAHILVETFVATASYTASMGKFAPSLTMKYLFYDYHGRTSKSDLAGLVARAAEFAVDKKTVSIWNQMLTSDGVRGGSALFVELDYDNNAALRVFFDASGNTRPSTDFISIARTAVVQSVMGDSDAQYLARLAENATWQNLDENGYNASIPGLADAQLTILQMEFFALLNWATAMQKVAEAVQQMISFSSSYTGSDLQSDHNFTDLRVKLGGALAGIVRKTSGDIIPMWGCFAIYDAHVTQKGQVSITYNAHAVTSTLSPQ